MTHPMKHLQELFQSSPYVPERVPDAYRSMCDNNRAEVLPCPRGKSKPHNFFPRRQIVGKGITSTMASSSGGRKKRLMSSLDGEVLERLSMKLNPRMLLKDYQSLAGRLKYTYEYIRNFARDRDPTLSLLQHWWSSKRGKEKTVSVLIEHLSDMERDDAVELLRPYEYYSSHEASEYDESLEPLVITVTTDVNRNYGRENDHRQMASAAQAKKSDMNRYMYPRPPDQKCEINQGASTSGFQTGMTRKYSRLAPRQKNDQINHGASTSGTLQTGPGAETTPEPIPMSQASFNNGSLGSSISTLGSEQFGRLFSEKQQASGPEVFEPAVDKNLQHIFSDPSKLDKHSMDPFYNPPQFDEDFAEDNDFYWARRDIRLHRPHTLDGSSASSVDGEYYRGTHIVENLNSGLRLMNYVGMTRDYGEPANPNEQFRRDIDPRYVPSGYRHEAAAPAEGHTHTAAADKVALVIGNQDYAHPKLKGLQYPEQDAADVAATLTRLNFKVVSLVNLTLTEMRTAMLAFCCLLGRGVYGVVYYAGHGYEDSGENFLLPVDSDLNYNREHSLRTQEILEAMQQCETSLNLLIIDSCRVSLPNKCGITVPRIKRNVKGNNIFAYSCCSQQESLEEPDCRNGMYCNHLLRRLTENRRVENILMDIATDFARTYNLSQRPCLETDCMMDFRLTDPIVHEFISEESMERCRRWNEAKRYPQEFSVQSADLQFILTCQAPFSNVLRVVVTTVKKTKECVTESHLTLTVKDPLRCLEGDCVDFENGDVLSKQIFDIINIQKLYKLQEPLILALEAMHKVDGKLCTYDKDLDIGWPLVSAVMCLWDNWLLGDRCKTTAV